MCDDNILWPSGIGVAERSADPANTRTLLRSLWLALCCATASRTFWLEIGFAHESGRQSIRSPDETEEDLGNPWSPDVVLVEEDAPTALFGNQNIASTSSANDDLKGKKRRKLSSQMSLFKCMMDSLTLKFTKYQADFDKKVLNRMEELENERIAMDERIKKMWTKFEEKRRIDEEEHELNIMNAFQDIMNQLKSNHAETT
ncbi:uncharacterized protein TNCV_2111931 [Trichonephila clavipes]|nr:uncharacterized protein TNCV_2111931 [Trichonephila clavipes]